MVVKSRSTLTTTSVLKKERSSLNQEEKSIGELPFDVKFKNFCTQFNSWIVPDVNIVLQEPLPGEFPEVSSLTSDIGNKTPETAKQQEEGKVPRHLEPSVPVVLAICENREIQTGLHTVVFKNFLVDRSMLISLRKALQSFETIRTLKLENCNLKNTDLRTLKTVLEKNEQIVDLSINGNPNPFQNFYILLKNKQLRVLSMKFCQINDRGLHLIAQQLTSAFHQPLMVLNLSSNFISDEGIESLANALRINRNLICLNLADNWITDIGCSALMNVLQTFAMKHEEILKRRDRIMSFLKKRNALREVYKEKFQQKASESSSQKSFSTVLKKIKKDSTRLSKDNISRSSKGPSTPRRKSSTKKQSFEGLVNEAADAEMKPDNHPFVKNCYAAENEIYCGGNLKLANLNLSYNKITADQLPKIIEVFNYQKTASQAEGLSHINLEGNLFSEYNNVISDINLLARRSYSKRFSIIGNESSHSARRKKSGLSKVSVNTLNN